MDILQQPNRGWLEMICGPMFSGKSEELIRRLRRAKYAQQRVLAFKPRIDNRYADDAIASHSQQQIPCVIVDDVAQVLASIAPGTQVIGIDEVQFLGFEVVPLVEQLADAGLRVICAGLDTDYRGVPWHPVPELLARAEYIQKTLAICVVCGNPASRTQRKVMGGDRVLIGSTDAYEARCRRCHYVDEPAQSVLGLEEA